MQQDTTETGRSPKLKQIDEIAQAMITDSHHGGNRAGRAMRDNWNRLAVLTKADRTKRTQAEITMRTQFQNAFSCGGDHADMMRVAAMAEASLES